MGISSVSSVTAPRRLRWGRWVFLLLALLVGVVLWRHLATPTQSSSGRGQSGFLVPSVRVAKAHLGDVPVTFDALGTVTPLANVTVRTQISGQLMSLGFQEGQMVGKGDFLAQVDPRPYQVALQQDQGQLARDQALLQQARTDLARYRILGRQDSIARQQLDDQASLVQQYEGTVQTDLGLVASAKLNLVYCHITAPVAGRVGLRQVDAGNYVQTSDTNGIVVLTQLQPITVIFTLPEDDLPAILSAMQGGTGLPVVASDRSNSQVLAKGTLAALDNEVDTTTGTVKLRAQFDNADMSLFPNQFVNAKLTVRVLHDAVVIPSAAVLTGAPGTFVYKLDDDGTVSVQTVTPGPSDGEMTSITAGLSAGDTVVIDGTDRLKDGAKVTVIADAGATTAPPSGSGISPWKHHHHHHPSGQSNRPAQE